MTFKPRTCVTLTCDDGTACNTREPISHFDGLVAAITWARRNGWLITNDKATCPACLRQADCKSTGHRWGGWKSREKDGIRYRDRPCLHCDADDYDPPLDVLGPKFQALRDAEEILRAAGQDGAR